MRKFFDRSGEISSIDLFSALCDVGREGKTGSVRFSRGAEVITLDFQEGVLSGLESPEALSAGAVLIRSGKLQRSTYDGLIVGEGEDRFAVAVASGVVSKKEAFWGRKIAAIEALSRLLSWPEGEYEYDAAPPSGESGGFRLPIDKWILELFLRSNDRPLVMHQLGATDLPLVKAEYFASAFAALGLTADADAVAGSIDGKRTIEQIVRRAPAEEFAVLKLLAALVTLGLVRPALEAPFPPVSEVSLEPAIAESEAGEAFPEPESRPEENRADISGIEELPEAPEVPEPLVEEAFEPLGGPAPIALPEESIPVAEEVASVPLFALTAPEPVGAERFSEEPPAADDFSSPDEPPRSFVAGTVVVIVLVLLAAGGGYYWKMRSAKSAAPAAVSAPPDASPEKKSPIQEKAQSAAKPAPEIEVSSPPASPPARREEKQPKRSASRTGTAWKSRLAEGEREFDRPGANRYSVQLELACEESTVEKALAADASSQKIWIAPKEFRGRTCYRVLWGRFKTIEAARAARDQVPPLFTGAGNRPAIVSLGSADKPRRR